jgi:inhibitor of KinA sporulation pathway (predicted exonuclease)
VRSDLGIRRPAQTVVFFDLEFTCWEGSLEWSWIDPSRPPEVLQAGFAHFDAASGRFVSTETSRVRPRANPELSGYCKGLLGVSQETSDGSPGLADVAPRISARVAALGPGPLFVSGGGEDYQFLESDCKGAGGARWSVA